MRANKCSKQPNSLLKTRLSMNRNAPLAHKHNCFKIQNNILDHRVFIALFSRVLCDSISQVLVGQLVSQSVGQSVGQLIGQLVGRSFGWSVSQSVGQSVGWSQSCLKGVSNVLKTF